MRLSRRPFLSHQSQILKRRWQLKATVFESSARTAALESCCRNAALIATKQQEKRRVRSLRAVLLVCAVKSCPRRRLHLQVCCRKLAAARHEMRRQMISFLSHTEVHSPVNHDRQYSRRQISVYTSTPRHASTAAP